MAVADEAQRLPGDKASATEKARGRRDSVQIHREDSTAATTDNAATEIGRAALPVFTPLVPFRATALGERSPRSSQVLKGSLAQHVAAQIRDT